MPLDLLSKQKLSTIQANEQLAKLRDKNIDTANKLAVDNTTALSNQEFMYSDKYKSGLNKVLDSFMASSSNLSSSTLEGLYNLTIGNMTGDYKDTTSAEIDAKYGVSSQRKNDERQAFLQSVKNGEFGSSISNLINIMPELLADSAPYIGTFSVAPAGAGVLAGARAVKMGKTLAEAGKVANKAKKKALAGGIVGLGLGDTNRQIQETKRQYGEETSALSALMAMGVNTTTEALQAVAFRNLLRPKSSLVEAGGDVVTEGVVESAQTAGEVLNKKKILGETSKDFNKKDATEILDSGILGTAMAGGMKAGVQAGKVVTDAGKLAGEDIKQYAKSKSQQALAKTLEARDVIKDQATNLVNEAKDLYETIKPDNETLKTYYNNITKLSKDELTSFINDVKTVDIVKKKEQVVDNILQFTDKLPANYINAFNHVKSKVKDTTKKLSTYKAIIDKLVKDPKVDDKIKEEAKKFTYIDEEYKSKAKPKSKLSMKDKEDLLNVDTTGPSVKTEYKPDSGTIYKPKSKPKVQTKPFNENVKPIVSRIVQAFHNSAYQTVKNKEGKTIVSNKTTSLRYLNKLSKDKTKASLPNQSFRPVVDTIVTTMRTTTPDKEIGYITRNSLINNLGKTFRKLHPKVDTSDLTPKQDDALTMDLGSRIYTTMQTAGIISESKITDSEGKDITIVTTKNYSLVKQLMEADKEYYDDLLNDTVLKPPKVVQDEVEVKDNKEDTVNKHRNIMIPKSIRNMVSKLRKQLWTTDSELYPMFKSLYNILTTAENEVAKQQAGTMLKILLEQHAINKNTHPNLVNSYTARNKAEFQKMLQGMEFLETMGDGYLQFDYSVSSNLRPSISNNVLNPQSDKRFSRWLLRPKDSTKKITNKNLEVVYLGFKEALSGIAPDKDKLSNTDIETVNDYLTEGTDNNNRLINIQNAVNNITNGKITKDDMTLISKIINKVGLHGLSNILELGKLSKYYTKNKTLVGASTSLRVEIDGKTNGLAFIVGQFPTFKSNFTQFFNRVGMYFNDKITTFQEYKKSGEDDSYEYIINEIINNPKTPIEQVLVKYNILGRSTVKDAIMRLGYGAKQEALTTTISYSIAEEIYNLYSKDRGAYQDVLDSLGVTHKGITGTTNEIKLVEALNKQISSNIVNSIKSKYTEVYSYSILFGQALGRLYTSKIKQSFNDNRSRFENETWYKTLNGLVSHNITYKELFDLGYTKLSNSEFKRMKEQLEELLPLTDTMDGEIPVYKIDDVGSIQFNSKIGTKQLVTTLKKKGLTAGVTLAPTGIQSLDAITASNVINQMQSPMLYIYDAGISDIEGVREWADNYQLEYFNTISNYNILAEQLDEVLKLQGDLPISKFLTDVTKEDRAFTNLYLSTVAQETGRRINTISQLSEAIKQIQKERLSEVKYVDQMTGIGSIKLEDFVNSTEDEQLETLLDEVEATPLEKNLIRDLAYNQIDDVEKTTIEVVDSLTDDNQLGEYSIDGKTNTIKIVPSNDKRVMYKTLLHEMVHKGTVRLLNKSKGFRSYVDNVLDALSPEIKDEYKLYTSNPEEFLAGLFGDKEFSNRISNQVIPESRLKGMSDKTLDKYINGESGILTNIVRALLGLLSTFGINLNNSSIHKNVIAHAIKASAIKKSGRGKSSHTFINTVDDKLSQYIDAKYESFRKQGKLILEDILNKHTTSTSASMKYLIKISPVFKKIVSVIDKGLGTDAVSKFLTDTTVTNPNMRERLDIALTLATNAKHEGDTYKEETIREIDSILGEVTDDTKVALRKEMVDTDLSVLSDDELQSVLDGNLGTMITEHENKLSDVEVKDSKALADFMVNQTPNLRLKFNATQIAFSTNNIDIVDKLTTLYAIKQTGLDNVSKLNRKQWSNLNMRHRTIKHKSTYTVSDANRIKGYFTYTGNDMEIKYIDKKDRELYSQKDGWKLLSDRGGYIAYRRNLIAKHREGFIPLNDIRAKGTLLFPEPSLNPYKDLANMKLPSSQVKRLVPLYSNGRVINFRYIMKNSTKAKIFGDIGIDKAMGESIKKVTTQAKSFKFKEWLSKALVGEDLNSDLPLLKVDRSNIPKGINKRYRPLNYT